MQSCQTSLAAPPVHYVSFLTTSPVIPDMCFHIHVRQAIGSPVMPSLPGRARRLRSYPPSHRRRQ